MLKGFVSVSVAFTINALFLGAFSQLGIIGLKLVQPDTAVVAYFAIAMQFFTTLMIFPISMTQAIVPGLSRAHRNKSEADLRIVATAMKAALIVGGMVAIAANALGPWMITLLFGDRYQAAGETFAVLSWAIGPYAAAFMAAQSLNSLDARGRGALTAVVMVGTHLLVMFGLLALEPAGSSAEGTIKAAAVGLLVGSIVGAATGLSVLGAQVNTPGHRWWITPMILIALPAGIMEIVSLPALLAVALSFALLLTLTWIAGVFSRDELDGIGERLGLRQLKPR